MTGPDVDLQEFIENPTFKALYIEKREAEKAGTVGELLQRWEVIFFLTSGAGRSNMKIYPKAKRRDEFCYLRNIPVNRPTVITDELFPLERGPQSWCYVREESIASETI